MANEFAARTSVEQVEEGAELAPKFDADGLVTCVATDAKSGDVLMVRMPEFCRLTTWSVPNAMRSNASRTTTR